MYVSRCAGVCVHKYVLLVCLGLNVYICVSRRRVFICVQVGVCMFVVLCVYVYVQCVGCVGVYPMGRRDYATIPTIIPPVSPNRILLPSRQKL